MCPPVGDAAGAPSVADRRDPPTFELDARAALQRLRTDPMGLLVEMATSCGDVARARVGRFTFFLLSHPDDVRDVLVVNQSRFEKGEVLEGARRLLGQGLLTSEGELHRRQRRLIQPVFHHQRLRDYVAMMVDRAERASDRWRAGAMIDVQDEMVLLTMAVLAKAVLDADIDGDEARLTARALASALDSFGSLASPFSRVLDGMPSVRNRELQRVMRTFDESVVRLVRERRARGVEGTDVLARLFAARDEETGATMDDRQVRDEVLTFMVAGHETWSNSLGWTWYLLSQHPAVRGRLDAELDEVLGGRAPTDEDVPRLAYTAMVYTEALRLYPPAWTVGRTALEDHELHGYSIPKGSIVLTSAWVVHRDARWFPEPLAFRPERWEPERAREIPTFAYFPFGAGQRVCIGMPLARLAGVLLLATIAQRWRLELVPGHPVEPTPPLLRPAAGLSMVARPRGGDSTAFTTRSAAGGGAPPS
jgi:cytochrome P450